MQRRAPEARFVYAFRRLLPAGRPRCPGPSLRELVMLCYGALENRAPFDPDRASTKAA